eukprot:m.204969 g.204969  ORF g.204969 m.204969 type:complete len:351 (+) comp32903_c5_seq22:2002-3054(+)
MDFYCVLRVATLVLCLNAHSVLSVESPFPDTCSEFSIWHKASERCVRTPNLAGGQRFTLSDECEAPDKFQRFGKPRVRFTMFSSIQKTFCVHPYGGTANRDDVPLVYSGSNCFDDALRLAMMWKPLDEAGGIELRHGQFTTRCVYPANGDGSANNPLVFDSRGCDTDDGVFVISCDGKNPFTRSTTTTTGTTTTTTTATTATDTALERLTGGLSDVEKLLEAQILKYDKHVEDLSADVEVLQKRVATAESDLKASNKIVTAQSKTLKSLQSALNAVADNNPGIEFPSAPQSCETIGGDSTPVIVSDGDTLRLQACSGDITFQSQDCSVNPCRLEAELRMLLQRLKTLAVV